MTNAPDFRRPGCPSFERVPSGKISAPLAALHLPDSLLHHGCVALAAVHRHHAHMAQEPCDKGVHLEQLLLSQHDHARAPKPRQHHEHRVYGRDMVRRKHKTAPFDKMLAPYDADAERNVPHQPRQRHNDAVKQNARPFPPQRVSFLRTACASAA